MFETPINAGMPSAVIPSTSTPGPKHERSGRAAPKEVAGRLRKQNDAVMACAGALSLIRDVLEAVSGGDIHLSDDAFYGLAAVAGHFADEMWDASGELPLAAETLEQMEGGDDQ